MSEELTHLVLTRFNTAVAYAPSPRRLETDWLKARLMLFERYCLRSVAGQRGADFKWLVFFDAASPAWFKEKINSFAALVTPIYIDGPLTDERIASSVAGTGLVSTPFLLTTRLDNDDGLARDHLALVQKAFRRQEREFVVFPFGLQSLRGHLYNVYWPTNPFLSLIEKVRNGGRFTTVYCVEHDRVREAGSVKSILSSPQWLQVLHSTNILNVMRGWPRLQSRSHPNFDVLWPDAIAEDSLAARIMCSAGAYGARARRLLEKPLQVR